MVALLRRLAALVGLVALLLVPVDAAAQGTVEVSPITARLDEATNTTEYTIQVLAPADADIQVNWNKPSCGTWERPAPTLFRWTHPHPPCTDPLLHPDEVITVLVTIRELDVRFTCTYRGADAGTGDACASRSLGLTPTPTAPASPTASSTSVPSPTTSAPSVEEPSNLPMLLAIVAGVLLAIGLVAFLVVAIRRRRERALDPCAPRQRRGMGYLASEIAAYAEENRAAALLAVGHGPLAGAAGDAVREAVGDLWAGSDGRAGGASWARSLGFEDELIRSTRSPELAGRARAWLGPEGDWRTASEWIAARITRRSGTGYQQAKSPGWSGAAGSILGRLTGDLPEPSAAAIAANAFASAAIAAADALARLNEASEAAGCPTVPIPDAVFVTIPADVDPSAPGARVLLHRLEGGEPVELPVGSATADDLAR